MAGMFYSLKVASEIEMTKDDLLDALMDLKHDLGKYIRLPFAMLKQEANSEDVRRTLGVALRQTRRKGDKVVTAREIWQSFLDEAEPYVSGFETYGRLENAVLKALSWENALDSEQGELDRDLIEADLTAVEGSIRKVIEEVTSDR